MGILRIVRISRLMSYWCTIKHNPLKRIFDFLFSLLFLLLFSPIFLIVALLIKSTSQGSVFYSHERIGRGGKKFLCYKFRTMHKNADQILKELLKKNPEMEREWRSFFKLKKDPRITSM